MLVPNIHWIIIEDAVETSKLVKSLLERAGLKSRSTLLNSKTPDDFKLKAKVMKMGACRSLLLSKITYRHAETPSNQIESKIVSFLGS